MRNARLPALIAACFLSALSCSEPMSPASTEEQIVFFSSRETTSSLGDIYRMKPDGSGVENLTKLAATYSYLDVTPDGRTVVFWSDRGNIGTNCDNIWSIGVDGSNLKQITPGPHCRYNPRLSPDGALLAFDRFSSSSGVAGVYVVTMQGTGERLVSDGLPAVQPTSCGQVPNTTIRTLGWLSNTRVMFYRFICGSTTTYYAVDTDGSNLTVLSYNAETAFLAPDRTRFVYKHTGLGTANAGEIAVMNLDGTNFRSVTANAVLPGRFDQEVSPWSPDSRRVYYADGPGGAGQQYITEVGSVQGAPLGVSAAFNGWSLRGDRLVWTRAVPNVSIMDIFVTNADGTGLVDLTKGQLRVNRYPVWTLTK